MRTILMILMKTILQTHYTIKALLSIIKMDNSIIEDFDHLYLEKLFEEKIYDWNHQLIHSSRGKPAVLFRGFKYN